MNDREIINHLMDIKERISIVETKLDSVMMKYHVQEKDIEALKVKILKAETSLKVVRYLTWVLFVTVPATMAAVAKIVKG